MVHRQSGLLICPCCGVHFKLRKALRNHATIIHPANAAAPPPSEVPTPLGSDDNGNPPAATPVVAPPAVTVTPVVAPALALPLLTPVTTPVLVISNPEPVIVTTRPVTPPPPVVPTLSVTPARAAASASDHQAAEEAAVHAALCRTLENLEQGLWCAM
jgi:hypothetical protein